MAETKYCSRCDQTLDLSLWIANPGRSDGLHSYCRSCHNELNAASSKRKRHQLLEELGGACVRCGFSDKRALQIDHVNSDGASQRKNGLRAQSAAFRLEVLANPENYQLLCANCNWIKREENKEATGRSNPIHKVPSGDRPRSPGKHTPEANARRSEGLKRYYETADEDKAIRSKRTKIYNDSLAPEQKAEISRKISTARTGTRKGPDGKWYRPD